MAPTLDKSQKLAKKLSKRLLFTGRKGNRNFYVHKSVYLSQNNVTKMSICVGRKIKK